VVRWQLIVLAQWIFEDYRISATKQILSWELRAMGYLYWTAIVRGRDRNHRVLGPRLIATGSGGLAHNHCNWTHSHCNEIAIKLTGTTLIAIGLGRRIDRDPIV
jgi:hypothetical protein